MKKKYLVVILTVIIGMAFYTLKAVLNSGDNNDNHSVITEIKAKASRLSTSMADVKENAASGQCNEYLAAFDFDPSFRWQQNKKQALKDLLSTLNGQVNRKQVFQAILSRSGIGHYHGYQLFTTRLQYKKYLLPASTDFNLYTADQISQLQVILKKNNLENIINALVEQKLPLDNWSYNKNDRVIYSLLSIVLNTVHQQFDDDELYVLLERLIDIGASVHLADLVYATRFKMTLDVLALFRREYTGEIDKRFLDSEQLHNLVTLAVNYNHVDALKYWLAEGVSAETFFYEDNALDILNYQTIKGSNADKKAIFLALINQGVSPNRASTNIKLRAWLSTKLQQKYESFLVSSDFHYFSVEEKKTVTQALTKISQLMLTDNDISFDIEQIPSPCIAIITKNLIHKAFSEKSTDITQKNKLPLDKTSESKEVDYDLLLETLLAQHLSPDEVVTGLGKNKDFSSKLAVSKYLSDLPEYMFVLHSPNPDELIESKNTEQPIQEVQLEEAIRSGDIPTALTLLSQGVTTKPSLAITAVISTNLAVLKAMYANGNDLNYTNRKGRNALLMAAILKKTDMVEYLLSVNVNLKPSEFGHDVLDIVIGALFENSSYLPILDQVINAGATIEKSHKQSMQGLKIINPQMYIDLTDKYPQLIL